MRKWWLRITQIFTLLLLVYVILATFKPHWIEQFRNSLVSPNTSEVAAQIENTPLAPYVGESVSFRSVVRIAAPAVVSIQATSSTDTQTDQQEAPLPFFEDTPNGLAENLGSGVIVDSKGYILTNNHVIENANHFEVQLIDGRRAQAEIVGSDPETDLAVLKIDLTDLPVIVLGDSEQLQVGDPVLAIGNPFGIGQTVTSGIVSALNRNRLGINTFESFIQTDAAINPGNSGGALVDMAGHLMGINTVIFSRSGGSQGVGFAIPTALAKSVLSSLIENGTVRRGFIGVIPIEITKKLAQTFHLQRQQGVWIKGVFVDSPAAKAGLRAGDVVLSLAHKPTDTVAQFLNTIASFTPGENYPMQVQRQGEEIQLTITPAERKQQLQNLQALQAPE